MSLSRLERRKKLIATSRAGSTGAFPFGQTTRLGYRSFAPIHPWTPGRIANQVLVACPSSLPARSETRRVAQIDIIMNPVTHDLPWKAPPATNLVRSIDLNVNRPRRSTAAHPPWDAQRPVRNPSFVASLALTNHQRHGSILWLIRHVCNAKTQPRNGRNR